MTRLLHAEASRIAVRRPNGDVLIDTNQAPPTLDGRATYLNVEIIFTETGKPITIVYDDGKWKKNYAGGKYKETAITLGHSGVPTKPDLVFGRYNLTQTHGTRWLATGGTIGLWYRWIANGEWTPFTGSVVLEQDLRSYAFDGEFCVGARWFFVDWYQGYWVIKPRWSVLAGSSNRYANQASIPNSYARFVGTIELAWGSFYGGEI